LQEQDGEAAAFIADVRRGWHLSEADSRAEIKNGYRVRSIAYEIRYALILSSINDLGTGAPPPLIARLINSGMWTITQGLSYARQVPTLNLRAISLATVATKTGGLVKHKILEEALGFVLTIRDAGTRSKGLASLAPHLCKALLLEALEAARAIDFDLYRIRALTGLAQYLPEALKSEVLQEASVAIEKVKDEHSKAECLNVLAGCLPPQQREETMRQLLAKMRASPFDFLKVQILVAAAPHLPGPLVEEALEAAQEIGMDMDRANALLSLAPRLAELGRQTEALKLVRSQSKEGSGRGQAQALARMAPFLNEEQLSEALKITGKLYFQDDRAVAVAGLAPYLSGKLLRRAFSIVESMKHAMFQVEPLAALVRRLPDNKREEQLEGVLREAIPEYESKAAQSEALARLAPNLPDRLLRVALSESRRIDDEKRQVKVVVGMASLLPQEQKVEAAEQARLKAEAIDRKRDRFKALVYVTPLIAETSSNAEAISVALSIKHPDHSAWALAGVLPRLSNTERDEILTRLLRDWRNARHSELVPDAFGHLASYLAASLWQEAVAFARANKWVSGQSKMLASMVHNAASIDGLREVLAFGSHIQEERAHSDIQVAAAGSLARLGRPEDSLACAQAVTDEGRRVEALERIIPHLPRALLTQVLTTVESLSYEGLRWSMLARLAPRFAALGEWNVAVQLMRSIKMYNQHALAAARMAAHAPDVDRLRIVDHALTIARNAQGEFEESEDWWQAEMFKTLAPHVPTERLEIALELILNIVGPGPREDALSAIATALTRLEPSEAYWLWSKALHRSAEVSRTGLLTNVLALAPLISYLGGAETIIGILEAVDDVGRWWPA
jgi:hypothetical protein